MTFQQLPDSRRAIVVALKERGSATIAQLAPHLGLTGEAVRQQLLQLRDDGWVESVLDRTSPPVRTGRPATKYRLTNAGEHLFPKHYDDLAVSMIDAVSEELGDEAAIRVLERVSNDRVDVLMPLIEGRTFEEKLDVMKGWYFEGDPYMAYERTNGDFKLIERNCPLYNAAMRRPVVCAVTINSLTRLLGVRIARDEKFQNGDGRCVFHVYAHEEIDADAWRFARET